MSDSYVSKFYLNQDNNPMHRKIIMSLKEQKVIHRKVLSIQTT